MGTQRLFRWELLGGRPGEWQRQRDERGVEARGGHRARVTKEWKEGVGSWDDDETGKLWDGHDMVSTINRDD